MKSIATKFLWTLSICLLCSSCVKNETTKSMLTESQAVELAKREFQKTGRSVENYRVTVESDTNEHKWIVWFDLNAKYPPPGSRHLVSIEKNTGRVVFMPGE